MKDMPFEVDDDRTILIYGVRYSMGIFQHLGLGPIGTVIQIVAREDGTVSLKQIYDYVPREPGARPDGLKALEAVSGELRERE
jgi:hypothetical protein